MELKQSRNVVKIEGSLDSKDFGIKFNPKMVAILSDKLYKDKQLAIIRELSTNAYDSHIDNKNPDQPFEVHLPSYFDHNFWIRDYGTGLSKERMDEVYRFYGASDKDHSNDFTGCLGLGSKVPFSYHTKTCTIESWYGGKHLIYTAYLGEDGLPKLDLLSELDSTEPNGVKITIPCAQYDVGNFSVAAIKVYTWFKTKPKFIGQTVPTIPKVENILESKTNGWALRRTEYGVHNGAIAIMGNLAYPIYFSDTNLKQEHTELMSCPLTLEFKLGDLDIEASREGLSYDTRTKSNIVIKLKKIVDELQKKVEDELVICDNIFDARCKVGAVYEKLPSQSLRKCIPFTTLQFKGKDLFHKDYYWNDLSFYIPQTLKKTGDLNCNKIDEHRGRIKVSSGRHCHWGKKFAFIECDLKLGNQSRGKHFFEQNKKDYDYVFLVGFKDTTQKDEFCDILGLEETRILKASALPKAPSTGTTRVSGTSNVTKTTKVMQFTVPNGSSAMNKHWTQTQRDLTLGGVYCEFNQYNVIGPKDPNGIHPCRLATIQDDINAIISVNNSKTNKIVDIFGVKTAILPKLAKNSQDWKNIFDIAIEEANKLATNLDFAKAIAIGDINMGGFNYKTSKYRFFLETLQELAKLTPQTIFETEVEKLSTYKKLKLKFENAISAFDNLQSYVDIQKPVLPKVELVETIEDKIYKTYPVLSMLNSVKNSDYAEIARYIKLIG